MLELVKNIPAINEAEQLVCRLVIQLFSVI